MKPDLNMNLDKTEVMLVGKLIGELRSGWKGKILSE